MTLALETKEREYGSERKVLLSRHIDVLEIRRDGRCIESHNDILKEKTVEVGVNGTTSIRLTCTPTDLKELAIGRLFTEGYISSAQAVSSVEVSDESSRIDVTLYQKQQPKKRSFVEVVPTAGGPNEVICRYAFPRAILRAYESKAWDPQEIFELCDLFSQDTPLHSLTSGTHSCRLAQGGKVIYISEDIGRHNALDKAIGYALMNSIDLRNVAVFISGRIPIDMAIKAIRSQIPLLVSKAAPTDQAVKLANKYGLVLIGQASNAKLTVFSGSECFVQ